MMGQQAGGQDQLFYSFNIEAHVPTDHLLRGIDQFLDLSELRRHLASFYSHTGRPSIDPELMIRMLLIGYCFGIRSERRLCEEVHLNLAYRWFCRLGMEDQVPDHSTFSKNRHGRFRDSGAFRHLFESVVRRSMAEGLVGGEGFAVDASVIKADANRTRGIPSVVARQDPKQATEAVTQYLAALEEEGISVPKNVSLTDPEARWTAAPGGPAFYAYSTNYLVDVDAGIIVDVEATAAYRTDEVESARSMLERVEERFGLKPERLIADTAYGTGPMLGWLVEQKEIEPHVPVWDKSERHDGTLSRADFTFDTGRDHYVCPAGKRLTSTGRATSDGALLYRANKLDCESCSLKPRCCPNTPVRKIPRSIHETARDAARDLSQTDAYRQSRKDRKKVEMLFAHLKRILNLDRLRLRGRSGAQDEFLMAATAQNLRRMAKWLAPEAPRVVGMAV
ncbi:MAG TPA: IS1182 family transposase [Vicinamibacterales bacterium]|nr:IS1182 family transposase [Vicinamibacterales bacterium]HZM34965.1 IS1182 family transposase [Burkholderiales bacterium]